MTRPLVIPPPGSPLVGLGPLLAGIATAANRDDMPPSGIVGREGLLTAPPPQCSLALFELTGSFAAGPPSPTWPDAPTDTWYCAPATRVEYYPATAATPNTWQTPAEQGDEDTYPEEVTIWAPGQPASEQPALAAQSGDRVWCFYDEGPGAWVFIARTPLSAYANLPDGIAHASSSSSGSGPYSPVKLTFSTALAHNIATGAGNPAVTIKAPGYYLIVATMQAESGGASGSGSLTEAFTFDIIQNGSIIPIASGQGHCHIPRDVDPNWVVTVSGTAYYLPAQPAAGGTFLVSTIVHCAAGDTIDLQATPADADCNFGGSLIILLIDNP